MDQAQPVRIPEAAELQGDVDVFGTGRSDGFGASWGSLLWELG